MAEQSIQFRSRGPAAPSVGGPGAGGNKDVLHVEGMTCGNCARHVTDALQRVNGVAFASVDLPSGRATVRWKSGSQSDTDRLVRAVEGAGFRAELTTLARGSTAVGGTIPALSVRPPRNPWFLPLVVSVPAAVLLLMGDWVLGLGMNRGFHWFALAVALPVQVIAGSGFYRGAWRQLRAGSSNMDTLVSLGSTAAFAFSVWALFNPVTPHLFFTEAVTILALVSLGHWLESRMSQKAGESLRALLDLAPPRARKLVANPNDRGETAANGLPSSTLEVEVDAATLVPGDFILLRSGDRVPVDAIVIEGVSAYDESMLTGESEPVEKRVSSRVLAGTVNQSSRQVARVVATGDATVLAGIIATVERAQSSKAGVQRLADRISAVFVPTVIAIAIAAAVAWYTSLTTVRALHDAVSAWLWHVHVPEAPAAAAFFILCSVLIVACPCAMGIATPVALMAGVNAAARRGILIRDAQALEKSGTITAAVFDKTGTLTEGRPVVANFEVMRSQATQVEIIRLAAALASTSQHPLSRAVSRLDSSGAMLSNATEARGGGLRAMIPPNACGNFRTVPIRLGSLRWLEEEEGVPVVGAETFVNEAYERGATVLGFAVDLELKALFALQDKLRMDASPLVRELRGPAFGFQVHVLSGDHARVVEGIALELGVDGTFAGVRPAEKADRIRDLQAKGQRVAFIGDGINDAPALAQADLGIAVARASDAAREAADIVLLRTELSGVREALVLARATLETIQQNLFWAFFYNVAAVPLAALGLLSPVVCALSMGLSDLIVIGNALLLARKKV